MELFSLSVLTDKDIKNIDQFLNIMSIIPLDSRIARIAGFLRRQYGIKTPDSVIGATALFTGSTLITRNYRDFSKVEGISVKKI